MPVKKRKAKLKSLPRPMVWEACTREQWQEHREHLLSVSHAGQRPWGWWLHEAPEPRDPEVAQCLQLHRLGVLTRAELSALIPRWLEFEQKARDIPFCEGPDRFLEGRRSYLAWRKWAGIPDDLIPPQCNLARMFKVKTDDRAQ
jgi:hypothetical protein